MSFSFSHFSPSSLPIKPSEYKFIYIYESTHIIHTGISCQSLQREIIYSLKMYKANAANLFNFHSMCFTFGARRKVKFLEVRRKFNDVLEKKFTENLFFLKKYFFLIVKFYFELLKQFNVKAKTFKKEAKMMTRFWMCVAVF